MTMRSVEKESAMKFWTCFVLAATAATGCAKQPDTTSTVSGQLAVDSYASKPSTVIAIDERGRRTVAQLDARSRFALSLEKGHSYSLVVVLGASEEHLVFPRGGGRLDTTFHVRSGAGTAWIGAVHHVVVEAQTAFIAPGGDAVAISSIRSAVVGTAPVPSSQTADGAPGECVDGIVRGSGQPCADDDAKVSCEDGEGEDEDEGEGAEDGEDDGQDGECENGVDAVTGLPCNDAEETDAPATGPMSVAEHNVPDELGGCDDGDEGEHED